VHRKWQLEEIFWLFPKVAVIRLLLLLAESRFGSQDVELEPPRGRTQDLRGLQVSWSRRGIPQLAFLWPPTVPSGPKLAREIITAAALAYSFTQYTWTCRMKIAEKTFEVTIFDIHEEIWAASG
jgi:hypothetical protein